MLAFTAALAAALFLAGCQSVPVDPHGTLDRVSDGVMRVGASPNGEWVSLPPGGEPEGREADLVRDFAGKLNARIEWTTGTEYVLAEGIKHGELDLMIAGLNDKTPWEKHSGLTRGYTESTDERGTRHKHVMLIRQGENAFLLELDKFLMEAMTSK
ncbi:ABC transporter substrate-binding protein [Arthrobacter sp. ISL-30]|nr:ABC transporter substrate-binding protein [Arthrobacter sp. ISL-30]